VVVGAVGVEHGGDELGVAAVDPPAVVVQAPHDGTFVEEALQLVVDAGSLARRCRA
jgi:hypothetical protein